MVLTRGGGCGGSWRCCCCKNGTVAGSGGIMYIIGCIIGGCIIGGIVGGGIIGAAIVTLLEAAGGGGVTSIRAAHKRSTWGNDKRSECEHGAKIEFYQKVKRS